MLIALVVCCLLILGACSRETAHEGKTSTTIISDKELVGIWRSVDHGDTTYMWFRYNGTGRKLNSTLDETDLLFKWYQKSNQLHIVHDHGRGTPKIISYQNDSLKLGKGMQLFRFLVRVEIDTTKFKQREQNALIPVSAVRPETELE